jgi:hypothetical protein
MSDFHILFALAATICIPALVGIAGFRRLDQSLKAVVILILIGMGTELLLFWLLIQGLNNLFIIHIYSIVEIILISFYFYRQIENTVIRNTILVAMASLCIFAVVYASRGDNLTAFNSAPRAFECAYFSVLSLFYFYEISTYRADVNAGHFFVNGTILFYFTSCFLIFSLSNYVSSNTETAMMMYSAHAYINAFCNLLYAAGLWQAFKRYYI